MTLRQWENLTPGRVCKVKLKAMTKAPAMYSDSDVFKNWKMVM